MRGRKPQPTVLRELHGNPAKRPLPKGEPIAVGLLTDPPEWLPEDAKESWRYAMTHAPRNVLRRIDRGVLTAWCVAESLHRQATMAQEAAGSLVYKPQQTATKDGVTVTTSSGVFLQSPYLAVINKQASILIKAASELGFSPAARPRLAPRDPADLPGPSHAESQGEHDAGEPRRSLAAFIASNPARRPVH